MRLPEFEYLHASSLEEAVTALSAEAGAVPLAGGTDLLVNMKHGVVRPKRLVDLKALPELAGIVAGEGRGMTIGSGTTLHAIATSGPVRADYPALAHAAQQVGAYAHQVMGTLGGNLCQANRCRYYNQSAAWRSVRATCCKAGGEICHVVRKQGECHATYCGDVAPVLIALGARVTVRGPAGERALALRDLYTHDGKKPLALTPGEILKAVWLPPPTGSTAYLKWRMRGALEFPIISLALHIEKDGDGRVCDARAVYSGVGPGPVEAEETELRLKGARLDAPFLEKIAAEGVKEVKPMRTSIHSAAYKRKMAGVLLVQALEESEGNR